MREHCAHIAGIVGIIGSGNIAGPTVTIVQRFDQAGIGFENFLGKAAALGAGAICFQTIGKFAVHIILEGAVR